MSQPRSIAKRMVSVCEKLWNHGDDALEAAKDAQSPLRARNYAAGRSGKGVVDDRTGEVACGRSGRSSLYDRLVKALTDLDQALIVVDNLIDLIFHRADRAAAKRELRQPGSGDCVACGEWVPGVGSDRIKSGLCPRHYTGWHRARKGGSTRAEYLDGVRQGLKAGDDA
jgi:hypothetical protein